MDLVQWATTPSWKDLDKKIIEIHLKNDLPVLEYLLDKEFECIFLNGSTVVENVSKYLRINIKDENIKYENKNYWVVSKFTNAIDRWI